MHQDQAGILKTMENKDENIKEGNLGYSTVLLKEGNPGHVQEVQEKEPMDELFLFLLLKHCDHRRTIHSSWS